MSGQSDLSCSCSLLTHDTVFAVYCALMRLVYVACHCVKRAPFYRLSDPGLGRECVVHVHTLMSTVTKLLEYLTPTVGTWWAQLYLPHSPLLCGFAEVKGSVSHGSMAKCLDAIGLKWMTVEWVAENMPRLKPNTASGGASLSNPFNPTSALNLNVLHV